VFITWYIVEQEGEGESNEAEEEAVIGFWSSFGWLAGMTVFIALLSEYVVDTIQVIALKCISYDYVWISLFEFIYWHKHL